MGVSILLLFVKYVAYKVTGSQAVLSDALESIVNVITPIIGIFVLKVASKPADRDHPYGHGKIEYFSSAFEGAFIFFAAALIVYQAMESLIVGHEIREIDLGLLISLAAGVCNLILGWYILRVGRRYHSAALAANGKHILSDVWTTAGVLVGLLLVRATGFVWLDSIAAIGVGLWLGWEGFKLVRGSLGGLLDEEDRDLINKIAKLFTKHRRPGIINIHATKIIRSGRYHHIDSHVVVPEYWDVVTTHERTTQFEKDVIRDYPVDGEIHFHIDPCRRAYCTACNVPDCPIRQKPFSKEINFTVPSLISPTEPIEFMSR